MAGSLAVVGAAGAPAMAIAADPEDRVRLATQELLDAMQERWPDADIGVRLPFENDGSRFRSAWFLAVLPARP